jgi:hypothetical protein
VRIEGLVWSGRFSSDDGVSTITIPSLTPAGGTKTNPPTKNKKRQPHLININSHIHQQPNQKQTGGCVGVVGCIALKRAFG